jgi:hypothetical protein
MESFVKDVGIEVKRELDVLTDLAIRRLNEDSCSPGQRIEALLEGKILDRIPFQIIDNTSRLVGRDIYDFFFDPVVRYKSLCAQLVRWGVPMTENASRINSYKLGEALGATLEYSRNEAPSTRQYILKRPEDFQALTLPNLDPYLEQDLWLIDTVQQRFMGLLGPSCCFLYSPFSWVGTYLREPNELLTDLYDRPGFVHRMCRFATDLQLAVAGRLSKSADCAFFMPGGFTDMLSPEQYREFALPYMAELVNAFPDCLFYMPIPADFRRIAEVYEPLAGHRKLVCMGSSIGPHNPLKSREELVEFCRIMDGLDRPYQVAIDQNTVKSGTPDEVMQAVENVVTSGSLERTMFRTDTLDPASPPENIDALVWAVRKSGKPKRQGGTR